MKVPEQKKTGFTLIELLVVIAVIAILAAILFPVFAMVRDKARQSACISNHRQMASAMLMYLQDYDERFPGGSGLNYTFAVPGPEGSWDKLPTRCCGNLLRDSIAARLLPYVRNTQIFVCPSNPTGEPPAATNKPWDGRITRVSYIWPHGISRGWSFPNWPSQKGKFDPGVPITLAEVSNPADLFITDEDIAFHGRLVCGEFRNTQAYADGHVKYAPFLDPCIPEKQRPYAWDWMNPRYPVDQTKPCEPSCAEQAARG